MTEKTVTGSVLIPLLRAVITALLVALTVVTGYGLWNLFTVWRLFWFVISSVALVSWWNISEHITDYIPDRQPVFEKTTQVEIISRDPQGVYKAGRYFDLPIGRKKSIAVANRFAQTENFSMATMVGAGNPLSRKEFEDLREYFIENGLAYWINEYSRNQGVALTRAGGAMMKRLQSSSKTRTHAYAQTEET